METPNFYATLPAAVRYDKNLKPSEKLLYAEIVGLTNVKGYCYASNAYFERLYDASTRTVQGWLKHLQNCGYIEIRASHLPAGWDDDSTADPRKNLRHPRRKLRGDPRKKMRRPPAKKCG